MLFTGVSTSARCGTQCRLTSTGDIAINNALVGYSWNESRDCYCAYSREKSPCRSIDNQPPSSADRCIGFADDSTGGVSGQATLIEQPFNEVCFRNDNFVGIYPVLDNANHVNNGNINDRTRINVLSNDILDAGAIETTGDPLLRVHSVVSRNIEGTCQISADGRAVTYGIGNFDFIGRTSCQYRAILGTDESTISPLTRIDIDVTRGAANAPTNRPSQPSE